MAQIKQTFLEGESPTLSLMSDSKLSLQLSRPDKHIPRKSNNIDIDGMFAITKTPMKIISMGQTFNFYLLRPAVLVKN